MKSGPTALSIPTKASMTWLEALMKPGCWTCLSYSEQWILHAVSCIRLEADPTTPSYNAMNLSQEELDVSHFCIRILSANIQVVKALEPLRTWSQTLSQIPKQRPALPSTSFPSRSSTGSHVFSSMGGNLAKNNLSAGLARSLHTLHFVHEYIQIHCELFSF